MAKNIVIFSDGTGNSAAKAQKTNVWRLYKALDLSGDAGVEQVAIYDDGVGTQALSPVRMFSGATGYGLKRNVIELYEALCRSYRPADGDRIYLFGFSRGAFTVRTLASLIHHCGLYPDLVGPELQDKSRAAYAAFRKIENNESPAGFDGVRPKIEFLGVWDTVSAYGLPFRDAMKVLDRFYRLSFRDRQLTPLVQRACHALSMDDERQTFHPMLWDEWKNRSSAEQARKEGQPEPEIEWDDRIKQVWFAGAHANVGGGYPDDNLSMVALDWMLERLDELEDDKRLKIIPSERERIHKQANANGKLYDSREGLKSYYRYSPRDVTAICDDDETKVKARKVIHPSVFERIRIGAKGYGPLNVPDDYPIDNETDSERRDRDQFLNEAWRFVDKRRWLYKLILGATVAVGVFPLVARYLLSLGCAPGQESEKFNVGLFCASNPTDDTRWLFDFVGSFVPGILDYWWNALVNHPVWIVIFALLFAVLFMRRKHLGEQTRINRVKAWVHLKLVQKSEETQPAAPGG